MSRDASDSPDSSPPAEDDDQQPRSHADTPTVRAGATPRAHANGKARDMVSGAGQARRNGHPKARTDPVPANGHPSEPAVPKPSRAAIEVDMRLRGHDDGITPAFVLRGLGPDPRFRRALAVKVLVLVENEVHAVLRKNPNLRHCELGGDYVNDAIEYLYRNDARYLRRWDPQRAKLSTYVGLITRRLVVRKLTHRVRGAHLPVQDDDVEPFPLDAGVHEASFEEELAYRECLDRLSSFMERYCNPRDHERFDALHGDQVPVEELAQREGVTPDAIYAWRSRFRKRLQTGLPDVVAVLKRLGRPKGRGRN